MKTGIANLLNIALSAAPTDGDDIIQVGPGDQDRIDGLGGFDTILLQPGGGSYHFGFSDGLTSIEALQGSAGNDTIEMHLASFLGLQSIDGGGGSDTVLLTTYDIGPIRTLDLSHMDVVGVKLYFRLLYADVPLTFKVKNKEAALSLVIASSQWSKTAIVDLSHTDQVFTVAERNRLFQNGIDTVIDHSGSYSYTKFSLNNLDHEYQFTRAGEAPVYLDVKRDASLSYITPGGGKLEVSAPYATLSIDQTGPIRLEEDAAKVRHILVDLTPDDGLNNKVDIGTIAANSQPGHWFIDFNENATATGIQEVIRSLQAQIAYAHDRAAFDYLVRMTLTDAANTEQDFFSDIYLLPKGAEALDPTGNSAPATDGPDSFLALWTIFRGDYSLNGGSGTDTLYLADSFREYDLRAFAEFSGFERIVFHQNGGLLYITANQLKGIEAITGADNTIGYYARIALVGEDRSIFDFRGKTVRGDYDIQNVVPYSTIVLSDKSLILPGSSQVQPQSNGIPGARIHLIGGTFTAAERAQLTEIGITDIWDDSDDGAGNAAPVINGLNGDSIKASSHQTVALDVGSNAAFSDDVRIRKVDVRVTNGGGTDTLGISTGGSTILLDGLTSGGRIADASSGTNVVFAHIYDVTNTSFEIMFNEDTTAERIDALMHALNYTHGGTAAGWQRQIVVTAWDGSDKTSSATISVAGPDPIPVTFTLTTGTDDFTGSGADDTFIAAENTLTAGDSLDGGAGNDILSFTGENGHTFRVASLNKLAGIETLQGTAADDTITIRGDQLADIKLIDGGAHSTGDALQVEGLSIDLSGIELRGIEFIMLQTDGTTITLDNKNAAKTVTGFGVSGDKLVLTSDILSDDERAVLHRRGIDIIEDKDHRITIHHAPTIANLAGDRTLLSAGQTVFLDAGRNAELASDEGLLSFLSVYITGSINGTEGHRLGVDTSGRVKLSNGLNPQSKITVDGIEIGSVWNVYVGDTLHFELNGSATPALVQEFVRALTYQNAKGALAAPVNIRIFTEDAAGRAVDAIVTVAAAEDPTNRAPVDIGLSKLVVAENAAGGSEIATLSAQDPDAGDTFTYTLLDNAGERFDIRDGKLVVKDGAKLDYEQAQSHTIKLKVTDRGGSGLSIEKTFTIAVSDVREPVSGATRAKDVLTGGIGADKINGGSGNDTLTGGAGQDVFVFDTALGKGTSAKNQNKKVNFDTIVDFHVGEDKIWLDHKIFTKLGKGGSETAPVVLNEKFFRLGRSKDGNDYITVKNSVVFYDRDGSGTKYKPVEIFKLVNKAALTAADFLVV